MKIRNSSLVLKINKNKYHEDKIIQYILVYFASLNFFENGAMLWTVFTVYTFVQYFSLKNRALILDVNVLTTLFISIFAACSAFIFFEFADVIKALLIFLSCIAGFMNYKCSNDKRKYIFKVITTIFSAYLTQVVLLLVYNLSIERVYDRVLMSLWKNDRIAVTLVALLCSIVIGYSFYIIFRSKTVPLKVFAAFCLIVVAFINILTATRTPFVIMFIVVIVGIVDSFISFKKKLSLIASLIASVLAFITLWTFNLFGLRTAILTSPLYYRFLAKGFETSRDTRILDHYSSMLEYPWGGSKISDIYGSAHNFLQETHDMYGIFAFIGMLVLTGVFFVQYVKLFRTKYKNDAVSLLLFIYTAVIPQLFVEPVFEGYGILFWNFVFIHMLAVLYIRDLDKTPQISDNE